MLYLACTLLRPRSLGMIMSIYFSHTLLGYTFGMLAVSALLFLHCMLALCMMYVCVYIWLLAYGWSCTLYDGLSWLGEWPSRYHRCFWPCNVGMHSRRLLLMHICAILCAWSSLYVFLDPCQLVTLVSPCMRHASTCSMLWRASTCLSMNILTLAIYTGTKPCWCAIEHQTWNSIEFSP